MRLVLVNPHISHYGKIVFNTLVGQRNQLKYSYFLNYYIKNYSKPVVFFIDWKRSSFNQMGICPPKFLIYLELLIWMLLNKINPFKRKVFFNIKKLDPKNDIIFDFVRGNDNCLYQQHEGIVVLHLTHYHIKSRILSEYIKKLKNGFFVAEGALIDNGFFRNYFPEVKNIYQLPFVYANRFKKIKDFKIRINRCLAVGSVLESANKDFVDYFGQGQVIHPMRKAIYENAERNKDFIDSYIYKYDDSNDLKKIDASDSLWAKFLKKYFPYRILYKILPNYQNQYFSFNIVEKYNQYKMFISPEEITGLPSINVFEGMACGCVFIGINDSMYTRLGMMDGVNYIAYKNGSLEDLIEKIKYYQENQDELEQIAKNGYEFVISHFNAKTVADKFWKDLEKLSDSFKSGRPEFYCSFVEERQMNSF